MHTPRWRATLRMRSLQKTNLGSQSDRCPLKALKRAVAATSSSQSSTSLLTISSTAEEEEELGGDEPIRDQQIPIVCVQAEAR